MLEVANMKYGYGELDVCIMADAVYGVQTTGFAEGILLRGSLHILLTQYSAKNDKEGAHQAAIQYTILNRQPIRRCIQVSMSDFEL